MAYTYKPSTMLIDQISTIVRTIREQQPSLDISIARLLDYSTKQLIEQYRTDPDKFLSNYQHHQQPKALNT